MAQSNKLTPKIYGKTGLERVSPELGRNLFFDCTVHDPSVGGGTGGTISGTFGSHNSGKTTLFLQLAEFTQYIEDGAGTKWDHFSDFLKGERENFKPETVFWRSFKSDNWSSLLPQFIKKSFPQFENFKPVRVFIQKDDTRVLSLFNYDDWKEYDIDLYRYKDADDIWRNHIKGGINVYYEPEEYIISPIMQGLYAKKVMMNKKKMKELENTVAENLFSFDLMYTILDKKSIDYYVSFFLDECQDILQQGAARPYYHYIKIFLEMEHQFRKDLFSLFIANQEIGTVEWSLVGRLMYYFLLPGLSAPPKASNINKNLLAQLKRSQRSLKDLPKGYRSVLIERKGDVFGRDSFPKFKYQPPPVMLRDRRYLPEENELSGIIEEPDEETEFYDIDNQEYLENTGAVW